MPTVASPLHSVVPDGRPYPNLAHAVLMAVAVVVLQGFGGFAFMLGGQVAGLLGLPADMFEITPPWLGAINVLTFGLVIWWGLLANRAPAREVLSTTPVPAGMIAGVVLASVGLAFVLVEVVIRLQLVLPIPEPFRKMFFEGPDLHEHRWSLGFLLVVVAPLTEELLFRGVVLRGLLARHRPAVAIATSAFLFAAVHLNPWQFVPASMLGLLFGWWYLRTRSLVPCILGHAVYNGCVFILAAAAPGVAEGAAGVDATSIQPGPWQPTVFGAAAAALGLGITAWTTREMAAERARTPPPLPAFSLPPPIAMPSTPPRLPPPLALTAVAAASDSPGAPEVEPPTGAA